MVSLNKVLEDLNKRLSIEEFPAKLTMEHSGEIQLCYGDTISKLALNYKDSNSIGEVMGDIAEKIKETPYWKIQHQKDQIDFLEKKLKQKEEELEEYLLIKRTLHSIGKAISGKITA